MTGSATRVVAELRAALSSSSVIDDPDMTCAYRHDEARLVAAGAPLAVVRAASREDVQSTLAIAARHLVPIVPRGAGTGLSGGANAVDGCIVVAMEAMARIVELDPASRLAVVEPGVVNADLDRAAAEVGMCFPPDPSSRTMSTIGGNLATNAGGLCCVRDGVTRDWTLGLEVVLAGGDVVRTGGRTRKDVAGYDLTSLFVGSEGTLGIITQATMRLRPLPAPTATLVAYFPTLVGAGRAIVDVLRSVTPSMLEVMDRTTIEAVEAMQPMDLDLGAAALVLARCAVGADRERVERCCAQAGASYVAATADADEGDMLIGARRLALPALERQGAVLLDDVGVPVERLPDLLGEVQRIADRHDVRIGTFGHAGDGNMHPTIVYDAADPGETARVGAAFDAILFGARALGGTITGEHGVGLLKADALAGHLDEATYALHRSIKRAVDPAGIMNPGKVLNVLRSK